MDLGIRGHCDGCFLSQAFRSDIRLQYLDYVKSGDDFADLEVVEESNLA
jgi:hypothetical protein